MELPLIPAHLVMVLEFDVMGLVVGREAVQKKRREIISPPPLQVVQHQALHEDASTELEMQGILKIVAGEAEVGLKTAERTIFHYYYFHNRPVQSSQKKFRG